MFRRLWRRLAGRRRDKRQAMLAPNPEITRWLVASGIDPYNTRRVIIDIDLDRPVLAYVEQYVEPGCFGPERLELSDMEVRIVEVDRPAEAEGGKD